MSDWRTLAACHSPYVDAGLFHPADNEGVKARKAREREAGDVCACCPVTSQCLLYSLGPPGASVQPGFWGGMNEDQRRTYKRNAARRAAA